MEHDLYDCPNDMSVRMREGRDEARTQVQEKWVFKNKNKNNSKIKNTPKGKNRRAGRELFASQHKTKDNGSAQDYRHQEAK